MLNRSLTAKRSASGFVRLWLPAAGVLLGAGWGSNQFTPMLLVYRHALGVGTGTLEALFGFYALGLIPGLLVAGPVSDAHGRRRVIVPAAALSLAGSVALVAGAANLPLLFLGRLLTGLSNGAVFAAGTAWLRECSKPPFGDADDQTAARRAAVAMTTGFAVGPLVAGMLAQWAGVPRILPYLPHIALMAGVLLLLRNGPETITDGAQSVSQRASLAAAFSGRFLSVVAPMAPWVFAAPAVAFGLLPNIVGADHAVNGIALTAAITSLCALAGISIQPVARRLDRGSFRNNAAVLGLLVLTAGLALASLTAQTGNVWLLVPCSIVLGCAYGLCLVAGLVEVQRLAHPRALAGLTAIFYALTYVGFAVPYLLAVATRLAGYALLLAVTAGIALGTAFIVRGARFNDHRSSVEQTSA